MMGGEEGSGTRSSLLWEVKRAILAKKPKWLVMENVSALVSQKFISTFNEWQLELEKYNYTNFAQILNSRDYGIPQNRERIFMVSILDCKSGFYFPNPIPLKVKLKDLLEDNVDESYYLSEEQISWVNEKLEM
jgi:DNA (cytosine-5)-methyltransferase 1